MAIRTTPARLWSVVAWIAFASWAGAEPPFRIEVEQLTVGPHHHFFGYIGQSLTTPWNASGRYVLALQTSFHDRMPTARDGADVCLVETATGRVIPIEKTHAWNFQQGTMFYWHPKEAETQFFFNDRDVASGRVYTVLYDHRHQARIREYRFEDVPVANGGVSPTGDFFLAINYGRMARLRPVTGYPEAADPTQDDPAPHNDGLFKIDVATGERRLLVSFATLKELVEQQGVEVADAQLYINHTLVSRNGKLVYFFVRGRIGKKSMAVNVPCTISAEGEGLAAHPHLGGHPEWDEGSVILGARDGRQVRYDVGLREVVGQIGEAGDFPNPGGDIALGPKAQWLANGNASADRRTSRYVVFRRRDGVRAVSPPLARGPYLRGVLRIDPAPRWNRDATEILVSAIAEDGTRQLHRLRIIDIPSDPAGSLGTKTE